MKNIIILICLSITAALSFGCSASMPGAKADIGSFALTGVDKSSPMSRELKMSLNMETFDDNKSGVNEMPERKIVAQFPAVMAVAWVEQQPSGQWCMTTPEPETIATIENAFNDIAAIRRVEPLVSFGPGSSNLTRIRKCAAALGADVLFVYTKNAVIEDFYNPLALGYFTGIGLFCLPGNSIQATAAAQGLLIDVKSGFPLAMVAVNAKLDGKAIAALNLKSKKRNSRDEVDAQCNAKMAADLKKKTASVIEQHKYASSN